MATQTHIHPTAYIYSGAEIDEGVTVGAFCVIGSSVKIGANTTLGSHVVIEGRTQIGRDNLISSFASLGSRPQDLKYKEEDTALEIGDKNQIREYCNISIGTVTGNAKTVIGSNNLLMVYTHVAHDCILGNQVIIANGVALAGHVEVSDKAVIGGLAGIHQFCRIGELAMIAGGAMVAQDVAPYCMVQGDRATMSGLNVVGLRRIGMQAEELSALKTMHRLVFQENLTLDDAAAKISSEIPGSEYKNKFLSFIQKTERGLCR